MDLKEENLNKLLELIKDVLGDAAEIDSSMRNTPGWDSLKTLQIVMALEEGGFRLPLEKIAEIKSVRDIVGMAAPPEAGRA